MMDSEQMYKKSVEILTMLQAEGVNPAEASLILNMGLAVLYHTESKYVGVGAEEYAKGIGESLKILLTNYNMPSPS